MRLINLLQSFFHHVRVNLCCRNVRMPQHHLHGRRSAPRSSRCVAKLCRSMCGVSRLPQRRLRPILAQDLPEQHPIQLVGPSDSGTDTLTALSPKSFGRDFLKIFLHCARAPAVPPAPAAPCFPFPCNEGSPDREVQIVNLQPAQFRHANPGRIHQLDHGLIAQTDRRQHVRLRKQAIHFLNAQEIPAGFGGISAIRSWPPGLLDHDPLRQRESEKMPDRHQIPRYGAASRLPLDRAIRKKSTTCRST